MKKSTPILHITAFVSLLFPIVFGNVQPAVEHFPSVKTVAGKHASPVPDADKASNDHRDMIYIRNIYGPFVMYKLDGEPNDRKFGEQIHCEGDSKQQFNLRKSSPRVKFNMETMTYKCPMPKEGGVIMKFSTNKLNYIFIASHAQMLELNKVKLIHNQGGNKTMDKPYFLLNEPMDRLLKLHEMQDKHNLTMFEIFNREHMANYKMKIDELAKAEGQKEEWKDFNETVTMFTEATLWDYVGNVSNFHNGQFMAYAEARKEENN